MRPSLFASKKSKARRSSVKVSRKRFFCPRLSGSQPPLGARPSLGSQIPHWNIASANCPRDSAPLMLLSAVLNVCTIAAKLRDPPRLCVRNPYGLG